MAGGARLALALAVVLAFAGASPAAGDRHSGLTDSIPAAGDRTAESTAKDATTAAVTPDDAAATGAPTDDAGADGTTTWTADQSADETVEIETEGFDPDYDPATVLDRVERLRDLPALQGITLHEYEPPADETYDARDVFGGIRPAGAKALQLYSNASTERRAPLGYTVERQAAVHIYLLNDSALAAFNVSQRAVLAHEFVHALQFQHDLLSPSRAALQSEFPRWTTDARLVTTALVEGDAMWVTEQYLRRYGGGDYSVTEYNRTLTRPAWTHSVAGTPYYYGYAFYERAGSAPTERTAAIRDPPGSTAELLHPGERLEPASIPDAPEIPESAEFSRIHADTAGELVVRHALRMNGLSFSRAAAAADGWAADRMFYYAAGGAAGPATRWVTVWESAGEAREFADAWRAMLAANGAAAPGGEGDGTVSVPASDQAPGMHYEIARDGATVRITAAERPETVDRLGDAIAEGAEAAVDSEPDVDSAAGTNESGAVSSPRRP
ncbi:MULTISPECIES: hypothetical protein [Halorussus]|uniref:hypothetical protein n=1 Tax=Halorussus TaxID=1070314 RepID=UPI001F0380C3|nr:MULTISPECIES: hypothetical protein [Halorussus]